MSHLGEVLQDEMPIDRAIAECGKCGKEFFDTKKEVAVSPYMAGDVITMKARAHRNNTGHDDLDVTLDKTELVREIDATITVNK